MKNELKLISCDNVERKRQSSGKFFQNATHLYPLSVMIDRVGVEKALAGQIEKKLKKKKGVDRKEDNLKSSNFFSKLQETVQKVSFLIPSLYILLAF